jgi:LysR family transcriptional activator of dmlA
MLDAVSERRREPAKRLRICSSFGFGRNVVAPVIAKLAAAHSKVQIRFEVFDRLVDTVAEGKRSVYRTDSCISKQSAGGETNCNSLPDCIGSG